MVLDFQTLVATETAEPEEIVPSPEVVVVEADDRYGKMTVEPLDPGYGMTLGNALRRVLYSSLPGTAVTWVKIEGVLHEYATIPHVREEVSEFLMNVRSIRLRSEVDRPGKLRLEVAGEGEVCAGDIISSSDFEVVNPELHLAAMDSSEARLSVEMNVERGKGYVVAPQGDGHPIGTLPVDAVFTPIRKVNYSVEKTRVGQRTDLERLVLEVWTDGTVVPLDAVRQAGDMLVNQFFLFANAQKSVEEGAEGTAVALKIPAEHYNIPVERLELSSRTLNCLKRAGINRVGEVLEMSRPELLRIRNFGEKSYAELFGRLRDMDLVPPELDPDRVEEEPEAEAESEGESQPAPDEDETASE
ncbi:MAG: DNA-directed RNA polymerase subunit alpha [Chloroflexi bacterium]|nr:DNA-directed RNA polymerase subunit alpha [Chloroflexota bacterium]